MHPRLPDSIVQSPNYIADQNLPSVLSEARNALRLTEFSAAAQAAERHRVHTVCHVTLAATVRGARTCAACSLCISYDPRSRQSKLHYLSFAQVGSPGSLFLPDFTLFQRCEQDA